MTAKLEPGPAKSGIVDGEGRHRHGGHGVMMMACCIPMLVVAVILVATGAASPGFLVVAIGCTVMMALMMGGMNRRNDGADRR